MTPLQRSAEATITGLSESICNMDFESSPAAFEMAQTYAEEIIQICRAVAHEQEGQRIERAHVHPIFAPVLSMVLGA